MTDNSPPDVNEPPAFDPQAYAFTLAENADGSTDRVSLGTVSATDPEGATLSYSLEGGNGSGMFEIDAAGGELFYTGAGEDFETGPGSFELTVRASDGDLFTDTSVVVGVADVQEVTAFGQQGYAFDLAENADGSTARVSLGTVAAVDPDGTALSYSIEGGNASGLFEIDTASGESFGLAENSDGSTARMSLGTVWAVDPEGTALSYSIEGGNASGLFEIDAASGELFYTGTGEDFEAGTGSFELTVRASDGELSVDTTVTVGVTDVQEDPTEEPAVEQVQESVSEPGGEDFSANTSTDGRVAVDGAATGKIGSSGDRDWFAVELVAGRTYTIDLKGDPTGDGTLRDTDLHGIHDADGNLISGTTNDDWGGTFNSRVTFTAVESGTYYIAAGAYSTRRGTYTVEVTDNSPPEEQQVAQEPPAFGAQAYAFNLAENADGSTSRASLGTVSATDPEGATPVYSIESSNVSVLFEIDASSGELFYVGKGEDFEAATGPFELTVRASDGDLTADTTVTVTVTDVQEAPAFGAQGYAFALAENSDGSTTRVLVGTVTATDPEGDTPSYRIMSGNDEELFEIDAASGELFYTGAGEDFEAATTGPFELTVRASDGELSVDTAVTVLFSGFSPGPDWGDDTLYGGNSHDTLYGDEGDDELYGGEGSDTFIFGPGDGEDRIEDFTLGQDRIDLTQFSSISGFADLTIYGDGTAAVIHFIGQDCIIRLSGVEVGDLDASAFLFAGGSPGTGGDPAVQEEQQSVSEPDGEDFYDDIFTDGRVAVGDSVTGNIDTSGDRDWFAVELEAGRTYRFDLMSSHTDDGELSDPLSARYLRRGWRLHRQNEG